MTYLMSQHSDTCPPIILMLCIYINIDSINEINLQKYRKIIGKKIGENIISSLEELLKQWAQKEEV